MKITFLKKLFGKVPEAPAAEPVKVSENPKPVAPYLTAYYTYGMHMYRSQGEDSSVYYVDESRGIREMVVDKQGVIQHFPGIVKEDFWVNQLDNRKALEPQIRFRTDFEKRNGRFIMLWQIQPDGFYYADEDGFGAEDCVEVKLYSFLNEEGKLAEPFRIYRVDRNEYYLEPKEDAT